MEHQVTTIDATKWVHTFRMQPFRIEDADVQDLEEIARVHRESWVDAYTGIYPQTRFDSEGHEFFVNYWKPVFADTNPVHKNLIARHLDTGAIIGVGVILPPTSEQPDIAEVDRLYVTPEFRRHGIGLAFLQEIRQHLLQHDIPTMGAWVVDGNPIGHSFWKKNGFTFDPSDPSAITEFDGDRTGIFLHHYLRSIATPLE